MPKIKTHKGASSRFHVTAGGKIMRMKGGKSHLRMRKAKRAKRMYHQKLPLSPGDKARVRKLIPYAAR